MEVSTAEAVHQVSRSVVFKTQFADSATFPQNQGRLDSLPPELLLVLFDWLRIISNAQDIPHIMHPLSRTLVTYIRRNLYRDIKIHPDAFDDFCDSVELHGLHANVTSLQFIDRNPRPTPERFNVERVFEFLTRADHLQLLDTGSCCGLVHGLFSPNFASASLPKLKSMKIRIPFGISLARTFRYRRLFAMLDTLEICVGMGRTGGSRWTILGCHEKEFDEEKPPQDGTESLVYSSEHVPVSIPPLRSFQNLRSVQLDLWDVEQGWTPLFPSINPQPLLHLSLSCHYAPLPALLVIPQRFYNLHTLSIKISHLEHPFFLALPQLDHLSDLSLDLHAYDNQLTLPLVGDTKVHSLRSYKILQGAAECAKRGPVRGHPGHQYRPGRAGILPAEGWASPDWSSRYRQQLGVLLELAGDAGVNVGSHLPQALLISEEHEVEWMKAFRFLETPEGKREMEWE